MRSRVSRLLAAVLLMWIAAAGTCGPLVLDPAGDRYSILPWADYVQLSPEPRGGEPPRLERWTPVDGHSLPIAYSTAVAWIRLHVAAGEDAVGRYYLEVPSAQLEEVSVYMTEPVEPAAVDLYPVFPVSFEAAGTYTVYVRLASDSYLGTPLYLTSSDSYLRGRAVREGVFYMLLGGIAFLAVFGFIQLRRTRHSLFAVVLLYLFLMFLGVWTGFGDAARVVWWSRPEIADAAFRPSFLLASASVLYITYRLLRTERSAPLMARLVAGGCLLAVLLVPFHTIAGTGAAFMWILALIMVMHVVTVAVLAALRGLADRTARNTVLSWVALVLFPLSSVGSRIELLPYSPHLEYAFVLALPVHMFLLFGAVTSHVAAGSVRTAPAARSCSMPVDGLESRLTELIGQERVYTEMGLTEEGLARRCGVSRHRLSEYLNRNLGTTFYAFLDAHRIPRACRLLTENASESVLEIAYAVGYNSKATFNRRFKHLTGVSPREYRKQHEKTSLSID